MEYNLSKNIKNGVLRSNTMQLNFQPIGYDRQYDGISTPNLVSPGTQQQQPEDKNTILSDKSSATAESHGVRWNSTGAPDASSLVHSDYSKDASQCFAEPFTLISCRCAHFDAFLPRLVSTSNSSRSAQLTKKKTSSTINDSKTLQHPCNHLLEETDAIRNLDGILDLFYPQSSEPPQNYMYASRNEEILLEQRIKLEEKFVQQAKALGQDYSSTFVGEGRSRKDSAASSKRAKVSGGDIRAKTTDSPNNFTGNISNGESLRLPPELSVHVETMLEVVRQNRDLYFSTIPHAVGSLPVQCRWCPRNEEDQKRSKYFVPPSTADDLIQCLECGYIGCGPNFANKTLNREHIILHFISSGHNFGITCGPRGNLYCFRCGDVVYHEIIDRIQFSTEIYYKFPWLSWGKETDAIRPVMEPSAFVVINDQLFWPGMIASYPSKASPILLQAARSCLKRSRIFKGELGCPGSAQWGKLASELAVFQSQRQKSERWKIQTPVGIYNLGNTCFMNCVLQCLLHCEPLQCHFLQRHAHPHVSCEMLRTCKMHQQHSTSSTGIVDNDPTNANNTGGQHCIACEIDRLFLETFGRVCGIDVLQAVSNDGPVASSVQNAASCTPTDTTSSSSKQMIETSVPVASGSQPFSMTSDKIGWPIIPSRLLTAAWKCGSMNHLAGYEQQDAHEFLQAFLDTMGKHENDFFLRAKLSSRSGSLVEEHKLLMNTDTKKNKPYTENIVKTTFEGCLRSVLICEVCGCRRSQMEPFINVSLPIFKERDRLNHSTLPIISSSFSADANTNNTVSSTISTRTRYSKISLQMCLEQFTSPEKLTDSVHCHWCDEKTATQKQHTFAKLPKILCLHLKRFDARANKKINDPVTFPINGLDMGPHLPHWREVLNTSTDKDDQSLDLVGAPSPQLLYDLFGVINHTGTLHQGHYVAIVKVNNHWYNCNDSFISYAGETIEESDVNAAYMLFYTRREKKARTEE